MTRLLIDGNSLLNAALLGGKDEENGRTIEVEGKKVQVNSAQYGVDKFMDSILAALEEFDAAPRQIVLVWDGANSKARRIAFLANYKAGRSKAPEVSEQLNIARDICTQTLLDLGAHVVSQPGMEADDVLGYLCKTLRNERNVVVTSDGDLTVLHDENTDVWRLGKLNENPYGRFPHKYITLYKALVGDTSDKIPGAKGFGDGAWVDLVRVFGFDGLELMEELIVKGELDKLREDVPALKSLQKIIDAKDMVATSWRVASLHIEDVNTMRKPLVIRAGMVKQWGETDNQAYVLRPYYGTKTLVTADNYDAVRARFARAVGASPFVALDIETSSSEASDMWLEALMRAVESDRERIDVLGHELTGMSLTFGANTQHTIYMSVDHADTNNITVDQCREMVELIPHQKMHTVIQNRQFEFSVLYLTWGDKWQDNGWGGFIPNAIDTKVGASYCDENLKKGLKQRSAHHLGYVQTSYEQVTTKSGPVGSLTGGKVKTLFKQEIKPAVFEDQPEQVDEETGAVYPGGARMVTPAVVEDWETREYKMRELPATHVLDYGCDDTICTAALHTHYKFVMDLENTWSVYLDVETLPEYLTSLAFVQGIKISIPKLKELERKDDASFEAAWKVLRDYLMTKGWEGTRCPLYTEMTPAAVKEAVSILLDGEFTTRRRKLNAMAEDIRAQFPDNHRADLLAIITEQEDLAALNEMVKRNFTGEPKINFGSPKQIQDLFYRVVGMKPRILNKLTDNQRNDPVMAAAFKKIRSAKKAGMDPFEGDWLTPDEYNAVISKASTDDTAVDSALAMDNLGEPEKEVLKAYKVIKQVQTRRNLFYRTYKAIPHWRDGNVHPSLNQAEAATRRYSSSGPNIQQLPSKGEGAHFREVLLPHCKDAVVISMDFSGQELRLGAELSGDENMTSCYVGDKLRDMHSLTAVAAAVQMWGKEVTYDEFQAMRKSKDPTVAEKAYALRASAKTVNFASQYGAMAAKIAETMMCTEEVAQAFLDAREAAFPGIVKWSEDVQTLAKECGYAQTMLGARRHLRDALLNENSYERSKAERQVGNFWIQGSAAEMTKLAMARVWAAGLVTGKYDARFLCPIHDELVFSVHRDDVVEFVIEAHACMVAPYADMKIPLESEIAIGPNFSSEFVVGTKPDPEAIRRVLNEIFHKQPQQEMEMA